MSTSSDSRNPVEALAEEFLDRKRRGEQPTLREYVDRYPELADDIRDLFPALMMMENLGESSGDTTGSLAANDGAAVAVRLQRLGDYRILREIGRGGMGVVYEADQESLGRRVALKVLSASSFLDPKQVRRFEREAKAAGKLHHTNIVPVFGVGRQDGHHYFVMQFIAGLGLDMVLDDLRRLRGEKSGAKPAAEASRSSGLTAADVAYSLLNGRFDADAPAGDKTTTCPCGDVNPAAGNGSPADSGSSQVILPGSSGLSASSDPDRHFYRSVARIGVQVAEALEYANRQGILHRDIKPSNLLLDNHGNVWVADFGLAKTAEADDLTHTGDILGTIRYMAPERFQGKCDARSDVYSLGLTLYELVALRPAYEASDRHKLIDLVLHDEPERLRKLAPSVPRDLETIIAKATSRDPARRYATASALAEDLRRFVEDRPIRARRVSSAERLARWCRRNKVLAVSIGLATAALLVVTVLAVLYAGEQTHLAAAQKRYADEQTRRADDQAEATKTITRMAVNLEEQSKALRTLLAESNRRLAMLNFEKGRAAFERGQVGPGMLWMAETYRNATEAGDTAWAQAASANLAAWRAIQPSLRAVFSHDGPVLEVAFSSDGRSVLTRSDDGTVQLWDAVSTRPIGPPLRLQSKIKAAQFSPDGKLVLTRSALEARLWDAHSGRAIGQPMLHSLGEIMLCAITPDGKTVLTEGLDQRTYRWDVSTGLPVGQPLWHDDFYAVAFSPDCRTALTLGINAHWKMRLWDLEHNRPIGRTVEHQRNIIQAVFSPDGKTVRVVFSPGVYSADRRVMNTGLNAGIQTGLWDASTGRPLGDTLTYEGAGSVLAFSPDGKTILTVGNKSAQVWTAVTAKPIGRPMVHQDDVLAGTFSPDGRIILTGSADRTARLWDAGSGLAIGEPMQHQDAVSAVAFSPHGKTVLTGSTDATARVWDARSERLVGKPLDIDRSHAQTLQGAVFSPDGRTILTASFDKTARLWDATTGRPAGPPLRHPQAVLSAAFSPDGKTIVTGGRDGLARLWRASTGEVVGKPMEIGFFPLAVAFSADGKNVFAGGKLWDAMTGQPIGRAFEDPGTVLSVAFSPDGKIVAGAAWGRAPRLWDATTGRALAERFKHQGRVRAVAFSRDGRTVCTGSDDKTACLWDTASGRLIGAPLEHGGEVRAVAFSPDGSLVLTGSSDKTARLWDTVTGQPIGRPMEHRAEVTAVAFSPDGKTLLTASRQSATTLEDYGAALWLWQTPARVSDDAPRVAAWVETATGLELDRQGSVRLLDNAAWRQRLEQLDKLGGPPSADHTQLLDPALFGPDPTARAVGLINLGRSEEAESAFAEAIRARPLNKSARSARGRFHLLCAEPDRAVADFAEAVRIWPDDFFLHERLCLALKAAGDEGGLKKAVAGLLDQFKNPIDFDEASRVAFTCALGPNVVDDPEIPIRLARSALKDASAPNESVPLPALGAALYRSGRFEEAIRSLEGRQNDPRTWAFLAMAHARQGHGPEAHRWLDRLRNHRADQGSAAKDELDKVASSLWTYFWELKLRLLRSEAEAVILYDPIFPADPFAH